MVAGGGGGGGSSVAYQEIPGGAVNGTNTVFGPLAFKPNSTNSLVVFVDGLALDKSQWTLSGLFITLNTAPIAGQSVYAYYLIKGIPTPSGWNYEALTLSGADITNQYKDLAYSVIVGSIDFYVDGVWQRPGTDYTINYTGGSGGNTRLTFSGDLASAGQNNLIAGDVIHIKYQY